MQIIDICGRSMVAAAFVCCMSTSGYAQFIETGSISVGSDLTQPPYSFYDSNHKEAGFDAELMDAIGKELGREIKFLDTRFENLILGLQGKRFDVIASAMYIKPARAAVVDFIPYMRAGIAIAARTDEKTPPRTPIDLCAKRVAVTKGSAEVIFLKTISAQCEKQSKAAIDVRMYSTGPEVAQAVLAGNVDAEVNDGGQLQEAVKHLGGRLAVTGNELYEHAVIGLGLKKGNSSVEHQIRDGLAKIRQKGIFQALLSKYNLSEPTEDDIAAAFKE